MTNEEYYEKCRDESEELRRDIADTRHPDRSDEARLKEAIKRIVDNWEGWHAEAMYQAQIEQDGRAGVAVIERHVRDVLEKLLRNLT